MKKVFIVFLVTLTVFQSCIVFSSCSKFEGSAENFIESGSFYSDLYNLIGSSFGGENSYYNPFIENGSCFDFSIDIENCKYNSILVGDGKGSATLSAVISPDFDIKSSISLDAFGQKTSLDATVLKNDMSLLFDSTNKPFYFDSEEDTDGIIKTALSYIDETINAATITTGKEAYKFNGTNFDADTVELNLNSDTVSKLANRITTLLINTPNLALNEMYFPIQDIVYSIQSEKIHISWKRYIKDDILCREVFKIYDNFNQYYILDIAYAKSGKHEYAEVSLKANNGDIVLTVFTLAVDKEVLDDNKFTTNTKLIVGDELYITASNSGTNNETEGKANINFVTEIGEVSLPVEYSYSFAEANGEKEHTYNFSLNNVFVGFDMTCKLTEKSAAESIQLTAPETEYFDLEKLEDIYDYSYSASPLFKSAFTNCFRLMQGKETVAPEVLPTDEPYSVDISFDTGEEFETNGEYGKEYISMLLSDKYAFKYFSYADSTGLEKTQYYEYKNNGQTVSNYVYSDGSKYTQLLKDYTKFEVRYDVKKIIYSEYDKTDYEATYPEPQYQYYQSGKCTYQDRELIYERYFSNVHNYYTFVFNEDGEVEIIILYSEIEDSTLYMFVEEISTNVPDNAFELPDYEKVSVHDYFE